MKYRKLRIAFSAVCGVLCLLLIVLWVRSYSLADICGVTFGHEKRTNFVSKNSRIWLIILDYKTFAWAIGKSREWDIRSELIPTPNPMAQTDDDLIKQTGAPRLPGFYLKRFNGYYRAVVPHSYPVLLAAILSAAPWVPWTKCRFSLRTLLISITLAALTLGLIATTR